MDATPSQTIGPFFHLCLTAKGSVGRLAGPDSAGERVQLAIRILDGDGALVDDAMVEIWQPDLRGFGRLATDANGTCVFETVRPDAARVPGGATLAPHIKILIFARGLLRGVATRLYFEGDPRNVEDPVLALVDPERRSTLLARRDSAAAARWNFEVHLCGDRETVFFDTEP